MRFFLKRPVKNGLVFLLILIQLLSGPFLIFAQEATQSALFELQKAQTIPNLPYPFKGNYNVTLKFGDKEVDTRLPPKHNGIDFDMPESTEIMAVDDGKIIEAGSGDYGTTVAIEHTWGKSIYRHLKEIAKIKTQNSNLEETIKPGDTVTKGQIIALSGSSGISTGPHLHFGIMPKDADVTNEYSGYIDPEPYLPTSASAQVLGEASASAQLPWEASAQASLDKFLAASTATSSAVLSATASASLTSTPEVGPLVPSEVEGDSSGVNLEDVSQNSDFSYNYKFDLQNGQSAHFYDKAQKRAGFAIADKDYNYKLRFFLKESTNSAQPKVENNKLEYPVKISDIPMTLSYEISPDRVKEELIIRDNPLSIRENLLPENSLKIAFDLQNEGLKLEKEGDEYVLKSADGSVYWKILKPTVKDTTGQSGDINLNIENGTATLEIDTNFLKTAAYPVVIDPTVVISTSSTTATLSTSPQRHLVQTADGTLHAFIQNGTLATTCGAGLQWLYSVSPYSTWSCGGQLSSDTTNLVFANARTDTSDNIYVVYSPTTLYGTTTDTHFRKLTVTKGSPWSWALEGEVNSDLLNSTASTTGYSYSVLEVQECNSPCTSRLWIATRYYDGTNYQISSYYSDGLTATPTFTLSQQTMSTAGTNSTTIPTLVRFGTTKIGMIYGTQNDGEGHFWRFRDDSDGLTSWSNKQNIMTNSTYGGSLFRVIASGSRLYLASNYGTTIVFSYYNGSAWSPKSTVSSTTATGLGVSLSTDGTNVWVFYQETTPTTGALSSSLSGSSILSYKKGVAPFTASDFNTNSIPVIAEHTTFNQVWQYVGTTSTYNDKTSPASNNTAADVAMVSGNNGASDDDMVYFGQNTSFDSLSWALSTNGAGGTITWEYCSTTHCTTNDWAALTFTASSNPNFTTGNGWGAFTTPGDWTTTQISTDAQAKYYIRARASGNFTTSPVGTQMAAIPQISSADFLAAPVSSTIYGIWRENATSPIKIRTSSVSVTTATTPAATAEISPTVAAYSSVTTATAYDKPRHLVRTSDGTLHAFIQAGTALACGGASGNNNTGLNWIYSTDSGATWTCGGQLSSSTSVYASATVDSNDNIYTVYSAAATGASASYDVFYRKLTKGAGSTWTLESAQTVLDASASVGYTYSTIETEGTTRMWLATRYYDNTNNYQVSVYYSDGLTASPAWTQSVAALDTAGTTSYHVPNLVRFGSKTGIIYQTNTGGTMFRSRADSDSLTAWTPEVSVGNCPLNTSVVGTSSGKIFLACSTTGIYFTYYNGYTWTTINTIDSTIASPFNEDISLSTDGTNVWIFYKDNTNVASGLPGSKILKYVTAGPPYTNFSSPVAVSSLHGTFDSVWLYDGSTYEAETTDAGDTDSADVQHSGTSGVVKDVDDIIYFGKTAKFDALSYDLSTNGDSGGRIAWEYCSAATNSVCDTWMPMVDYHAVSNSTFAGDGYITFTPHSDWVTNKINSEDTAYYYVRARVTTAYTTAPVGVQIGSFPATYYPTTLPDVVSNNIYLMWTENAASPTRIRFNTISVATTSAPTATAEISPAVAGYSSGTTATQASTQRHIVRTSDGTLHAFIQARTVLACGGATGNNNLGLNWLYSTNSGSSWTCGGQLSSNTSVAFYADARVDSSDNVYVVYSVANNLGSTAYDVFYRKFTVNKVSSPWTWTMDTSEQTVLDSISSTTAYTNAVIELEGTTRMWLALRYYNGTNYQVSVYYSDSLNSATDASPPAWTRSIETLNTAGTNGARSYPTIVRFGSNIGVIYNDDGASNGGLRWRYRADSDDLTSWVAQPSTQLSNGGMATATFSAIGDSSGNIYLASIPGTTVSFTRYDGSSWSTLATVSSSAGNSTFTSVSLDNASTPNVYVIYGETTGLSSGLSGSRKLVYKKGVSPYATANFDTNSTTILSNHTIFDKVWQYVAATTTYTDDTTDAGDTDSADVAMVSAVGDIMYFGKTAKFDAVSYDLSTAGVGGVVTWEYYNGSSWMPLVDYYAISWPTFGADGYITFIPHSDWATVAVNGEGTAYYYVRARTTTAYTTAPVGVEMAAIPQINWGSLAATTNGFYSLWTENAASPTRVRYYGWGPANPTSLAQKKVTGGATISTAGWTTENQVQFTASVSDAKSTETLQLCVEKQPLGTAFTNSGDTCGNAVASGSTATVTIGSLDDGQYHWQARVKNSGDFYSNWASYDTNAESASDFGVDITVPVAQASVASTSHTISTWSTDNTIDMSWTAATDATSGVAGYVYAFNTSASADIGTITNLASNATSVTSGTLSDDTSHYFHIRAIDTAGNEGTQTNVGPFYIDVTAPVTSGTPSSIPSSPSQTTIPAWSWTTATDATSGLTATPYTIRWSTDSGFGTYSSATSATNSYTNSTLADALWYLRVIAADTAGNSANYTTASYRVDTTAPGSPGTPSTTTPNNDSTPIWDWTAATDSGSGVASYTIQWCSDQSSFGTGTCATYTDTSATNSFTHSTALTDGTWYLRVKSVDNVGLESAYTSAGTVVVDTQTPYGVAGLSPNENPSPSSSVTWSWTASTGDNTGGSGLASTYALLWCSNSGFTQNCSNTTVANTATSYQTTGLTTGNTWYFKVTVSDAAGNSTSTTSSAAVDTTLPTTPGTPSTTTPTTDSTLVWTWSASVPSGSATISSYTIDWSTGSGFTTYTSASSTTNSYTHTVALADGTWYVRVKSTDSLDKVSNYSSNGTVVIDTTAPTTPGTPTNTTAADDTTPTWTWTASTDSGVGLASPVYTVYWCTNSSFTGCSSYTDTVNTNSYTHSTPLESTTWYFKVTATDLLGNASTSSTASTDLKTDKTAPTGSIIIKSGDSYTTSRSVTLTIAATDNGDPASLIQMKVSENSDLSGASYESYNTSKSWTFSTTEGTKYIYVRFKDSAGNESTIYSSSIVYDVTSPNSFDLISPDDNYYTNQERPTFKWKAASTLDATAGLSYYKLTITNIDGNNFTIDNISPSRTSNYETDKYLISYENFGDNDSSNNYISVTTKSSSLWSKSENYGKLAEGKDSWQITAVDKAGNSISGSRTIYADYTNPVLGSISITNLGDYDDYLLLTSLKPNFKGDASDNQFPDRLELLLYKQISFLGFKINETLTVEQKVSLKNTGSASSFSFDLPPDRDFDFGKYRLVAAILDKAGNRSSSQTFNLQILTTEKARQMLAAKDKVKISDIKEKTEITLKELEKKAKFRKQKEAAELDKMLDNINQTVTSIKHGLIEFVTAGSKQTLLFAYKTNHNISAFLVNFEKKTQEKIIQTQKETNELIVKAFNQIIQLTASTGQKAYQESQLIIQNIVELSLEIKKNVDITINNAAKESKLIAKSIAVYLPLAARQNLSALNKNVHKLNNNITQTTEEIKKNIDKAGKETSDITAQLLKTGGNISRTLESSHANVEEAFKKNHKDNADETAKAMETVEKISAGISTQVLTTLQDANTGLTNTLSNSEQKLENKITETYDQTSKTLKSTGEGIRLVYQSLRKPIDQTTGFMGRVGAGIDTFVAVVFDQTPTMITDVTIEDIGADYALVSWKTNHFAWGKVNYGEDLKYGKEVILKKREKNHTAKLIGLKAGKRYFFEVMSQNKNYAFDAYYSFETKSSK